MLNDAGGHISILSGGFPCQPVSGAGKKLGCEDERWMWGDYYRIIKETHPDWILIENSYRLLIIPEWDGIQSDLERAGYKLLAFRIPAKGVGAPHVRERAFIIAHAEDKSGLETSKEFSTIREERHSRIMSEFSPEYTGATDTVRIGMETSSCVGQFKVREAETDSSMAGQDLSGKSADTNMWGDGDSISQSIGVSGGLSAGKRFRSGDWESCQLPDWKTYPPEFCRMDDGIPLRVDKPRLQALGNAIVPRVVYPFFRAIRFIETGE